MDAKEAKAKALANKERIKETIELKSHKAKNADTSLLLEHFKKKIEESVLKGHLSTEPIKFALDRFSDEIVRSVAEELREEGYNLNMDKHNLYQTVTFTITW